MSSPTSEGRGPAEVSATITDTLPSRRPGLQRKRDSPPTWGIALDPGVSATRDRRASGIEPDPLRARVSTSRRGFGERRGPVFRGHRVLLDNQVAGDARWAPRPRAQPRGGGRKVDARVRSARTFAGFAVRAREAPGSALRRGRLGSFGRGTWINLRVRSARAPSAAAGGGEPHGRLSRTKANRAEPKANRTERKADARVRSARGPRVRPAHRPASPDPGPRTGRTHDRAGPSIPGVGRPVDGTPRNRERYPPT